MKPTAFRIIVCLLLLHSLVSGESADVVALKTFIPTPAFRSGPISVTATNLEPRSSAPRATFWVPTCTTNLAAGRPVSASNTNLAPSLLTKITDGEKSSSENSCVEVGFRKQWVKIDLEQDAEIFAVLVWHCYSEHSIFFDVVAQVSPDPDFQREVTTIFNNDTDNTLGLGIGKDQHYHETHEGKLMDAKGVKGRYVRLCSNGSARDLSNYYMEVEVFGRPLPQSESTSGSATNAPSQK